MPPPKPGSFATTLRHGIPHTVLVVSNGTENCHVLDILRCITRECAAICVTNLVHSTVVRTELLTELPESKYPYAEEL